MKNKIVLIAIALLASLPAAFSQITIPSDGSDGALNVTAANLVIDLSQAVTGTFSDNNSANVGKGIYDPVRWAIVFKYSSVNIASGRTVSFINHPSHAPVVWLVQGSATIAGTLSLNGQENYNSLLLSEPGPGGFRGGVAGSGGVGAGLGIGGTNHNAANASYASVYGNPSLVPLIGGSGAGAYQSLYGGGGGAGAVLIAAANAISVSGAIVANGGSGTGYDGSGGGIRLVANTIGGNGTLNANRNGRIRLEANLVTGTLAPLPQTIAVPPANPPVIWPSDTAPSVRIVSVDTSTAPLYPVANLDVSADVGITVNAAVVVTLQTTNFPTNGTVKIRSAGKFSPNAVLGTATFVSGNATLATWTASVNFGTGFTTLQAIATVP